MDADELRRHRDVIKATFDSVSNAYDNPALRFFDEAARHVAESLDLRGDEHVLDVATGTGKVALLVAERLTAGRITGVDLSTGMLGQARCKAQARGLRNAEFVEMDMQQLAFPGHHFNAAICAFGIFFVPDMDAQLARMAKVVKPGGTIAITNFHQSYFDPLRSMMVQRLVGMGVQMPPQIWLEIATEAKCRALFERAHLRDIRVELRNEGYFLTGPEQWWDVIWKAGFRRMVAQLPEPELARFKREHLHDVEGLRTPDGIRLDVPVLYTSGKKPS